MKTNEPSDRRIKRKYRWHHPAVYLAILLNFIVYVILRVIVCKRHNLDVPVTEETATKRLIWIAISCLIGLTGIGLCCGSIKWTFAPGNLANSEIGVIGIVLGAVFLVAGALVGARAALILYPKKMTKSATWFSGAHWEYLERFPDLPPEM